MPSSTVPHNIYMPLAADNVKQAGPAKLASDIAAVAQTTNNALTLVEGRALASAAADATTKANAALTKSKAYTNQVVDTSHLARDADGTPYFSPGSMTLRVFTDTDGVPFFLDA